MSVIERFHCIYLCTSIQYVRVCACVRACVCVCLHMYPCMHRLHSLLWTAHGMEGDSAPSGLLVGGADGGTITLWNANSIIE